MQRLSEWERNNFRVSTNPPELTVIFPSREIYISPDLAAKLHMTPAALPKTLDQWYELCHPSDHLQIARLENFLRSSEADITLTRALYCGDGKYRTFRLEAHAFRDSRNNPAKLLGREIPALTAWLESADDGDTIELTAGSGVVRVLEAVRIDGVKVLQDISRIDDSEREIQTLRRGLQRRLFSMTERLPQADYTESDISLRDKLDETLRLSLNVLTGNPLLKAIRRAMNEPTLTAGLCGLTESGKTSFLNALLGESLLPEHNPSGVPILCREGESRSAKLIYQDGRTENVGAKTLSTSFLAETLKRSGISRISITIPGALIPSGVSIMDTAGYDAVANAGSSSLRNLLPELDVILYVLPVRSGLKGSDYAYLHEISAVSERVMILLSRSDLESEDREAGRVVRTVEDKISRNIDSLRRSMKRITNQEVPVVPVSSRLGSENFYSRNNPEWSSSNIESIMKSLACQRISPLTRALILRAERTLKILDSALTDKRITRSSRWRLQEYAGTLREILSEHSDLAGAVEPVMMNPVQTQSSESGKNLLTSLVTSLREHDFRNRFYSHKAFKNQRNIVLLSADKSQSLKLYSRLAHNILAEELPDGGASDSEWLCSGNAAPFECVMLPVLSPGENILIAPGDHTLKDDLDWLELFRKFTPVVSADLLRFSSGMSDMSQASYFAGLAQSEWVLSFGSAGLLSRSAVTRLPDRIREFTEGCGLRMPEIFMFENYRIY